MATKTTNIGLTKPSYKDSTDIGVINSNMDIIDGKIGEIPSNKSVKEVIDEKLNKPGVVGVNNQILRSNGDGTTRWDNAATAEEIGAAVDDWLDDNVPTGETLIIDKTLTVEDAAAGAKAAGNIVMVSDTQPQSTANRVWVMKTTNEEVEVPTWQEHSAQANDANGNLRILNSRNLLFLNDTFESGDITIIGDLANYRYNISAASSETEDYVDLLEQEDSIAPFEAGKDIYLRFQSANSHIHVQIYETADGTTWTSICKYAASEDERIFQLASTSQGVRIRILVDANNAVSSTFELTFSDQPSNAELLRKMQSIENVVNNKFLLFKNALPDFLDQFIQLLTYLAYTAPNHNAAAAITAAQNAITALATYYPITKSLTYCTLSNAANNVVDGYAYTTSVVPDAGYVIDTVTVTMGGVDITSTAWNSGTNTISIASVTDSIVIMAAATSEPVTLSSIDAVFSQGSATVYETDSLDTLKQYLTVTANYSDSSTSEIGSSFYTLSGTLTTGTSTVTATYQGKTATFNVTVTQTPLNINSITATFNQGNVEIYNEDSLDTLKQYLTVTASFTDGNTLTIGSSSYTLTGTLIVGTSTITVSYGGQTDTFDVTVSTTPVTLTSIAAALNLNGVVIRDGDSLNDLKQYLTVTGTYSDNSTETISSSDYTLSGSLTLASGEYDASTQTITVSSGGKTTTFSVTVYNTMTADRATLPSGYTQLAMIYSEIADGVGPYIDTGIHSYDVDHVKYAVQVNAEPSNGTNLHVLSNERTYYPYFRKGNSGAKNFQVKNNKYDATATGLDATWDINTNYVIEAYPAVKINGVTVATVDDGGAAAGGSNLYMFARSGSDGTAYNYGTLRFFYLEMYDSQDQLIHQFIPCKNGSNVVGMYDTVSEAFHTSANASTFGAGGAM